jgi:hypothetical protein
MTNTPRTLVYVSEAVFFFPLVCFCGAGLSFPESSSTSSTSAMLSSAVSSLVASTFFFGAAFDFGAALVALVAGFAAAFLGGALV